jgi:hypothetical protein
MQIYSAQLKGYEVRTEVFDGVTYKVVPTVMMVEGVHHGSHGAIYHSPEEFGKVPESFNGIPVTLTHPNTEEGYVSANSPQILEQFALGSVFNSHFEDNKLKGEVWFVEEKLGAYIDLNERIDNGEVINVSIGIFSEEIEVSGTWRDEQYDSIATNYRPDHLAVLPDEVGACSVADGCGLRVNKKDMSNKEKEKQELVVNVDNTPQVLQQLNKQGYKIDLSVFEEGMQSTLEKVRGKLYSMDNDEAYYYLEDVFDSFLIYRKEDRTNINQSTMYKRSYTITEGVVTFGDDAQRVNKTVEYVPVSSENNLNNNNLKVNKMSEEKCTPCVKERADALINNEATPYSEDHRDWLQSLEVEQLDLMKPIEPKVTTNKAEVTPELAINALKEGIKTTEDFINLIPDESMKEQLISANALHTKYKTSLVKGIMDNAEGVWEEDELKGMKVDQLEKLAKTANVPTEQSVQANYAGAAAGEKEIDLEVNAEEDEDYAETMLTAYTTKEQK